MTNEVKSVVGYEGLYSVDRHGNITNDKTGHRMTPCKNSWGYMNVYLRKNGKGKSEKVHRIVANAFLPNPLNKREVNHIDGNKANNELGNLEWATTKENINHAVTTGLIPHKRIRIIETGNVYSSAADCARQIGGSYADIYHCLYGQRKTHKGYHYEYVD